MNEFLRANRGPVFSGSTDSSGMSESSVASQQAHTDAMDEYGAQEDQASKDESTFQSLIKDSINNQGSW